MMCKRTWIGEHRGASERPLENANGGEHESGANLDEGGLRGTTGLQWILLHYLQQLVSQQGQRYTLQKLRTWKLRNQILSSRIENVRMWSTKGLAFLAVEGTPNIFEPVSVFLSSM